MTDDQVPASAVQPAPFEEVAGQFLAYLRASGCSPNTARAYSHDLTHLAAFLVEQGLDWRMLTPARAVDLLIHLRNKRSRRRGPGHHPSLATIEGERAVPRLSAATINRRLAAVSSFYEWARATDRFAGPGPIVRVHDRAAARVSERNPSAIGRFSTASLHSRRRAAPCG
jgi:site-specific recombinase XerD